MTGVAVLLVGALAFDLSADRMGLTFAGAVLGAVAALPVAAVIAVVWSRRSWRARLADARYAGTGARAAAFIVLVRIPIGTALYEELLFRGVLFAAFHGAGTVPATIVTSIAFGLWHVEPTRLLARANRPGATKTRVARAVAAGVVLTAFAGVWFAWLRVEGGGIAAPAVFHAMVNAAGALAAIGAHRYGEPAAGASGRR